MAVTKKCPKCLGALEIPYPTPDLIVCPTCGANIKRKPAATGSSNPPVAASVATNSTPVSPAPAKSSRGFLVVVGLVAGLFVFGCLTIGGLAWVWIGGDTGPQAKVPKDKPVDPVKDEKIVPPVVKLPPAISPQAQAAIDKAVLHLKKRVLEKGHIFTSDIQRNMHEENVGVTALAGLALLEAKVPPDDPAIQTVLAKVREVGPNLDMIYTLGTVLFFLNRLHDDAPLNNTDRELLRSIALRVIAGQRTNGRWGYSNPAITKDDEQKLLQRLSANSYKPDRPADLTSNSMTQFALLAIWGSRRHDIPVRYVVFAGADSFHQSQGPNGSWSYYPDDAQLHDANTCAGLIALAMESTLREDKEFKNQTANDPPANPQAKEHCEKAFTFLGKVIGRTKNDPTIESSYNGKFFKADAWGDYYFLWSLERVAVIYDVKTIGGKDWYAWGSKVILENQHADGSWVDRHGDVADTCFAILFLMRANLARDITESIRTRDGQIISDGK
ncbi:MAG: hypothetical protein EXS16_05030 [Gemmataceae bacterium]|nr:hypothetical protein [Gemmataceae bacterium]